MNVAIVGFTNEARAVIEACENKFLDDVFIKYVLTNYKEVNRIYDLIKHKVVLNYDRIINDLSIDTIMVLEDTLEAFIAASFGCLTENNNIL